jgi:hypothetical protein
MLKFINFYEYMRYLFDGEKKIKQAAEIIKAILEAQSPRITNIAEKMDGKSDACCKAIHRFLGQVEVKGILLRLFQEEAEFVIGDPTEMPRYKAPKTGYVGTINDGETCGYWLMTLSTAFRGRAIPFHFITYSSKTIGAQATSRNQEQFRAFAGIKELLGERPLVLDREFSYLELLQYLVIEKVNFVIRLNRGSKQPRFTDQDGHPLKLLILPGEEIIYPNVFYLGRVKVNLIGVWRKGFSSPMWVMTNLDPQKGLKIYQKRMKIDESFRDLKDLLHLEKLMNKSQRNLEKMIALTMIAYVVGALFGEAVRVVTYGKMLPDQVQSTLLDGIYQSVQQNSKWHLYSGLFILLKQKPRLPDPILSSLSLSVLSVFENLVYGFVPTFV